MVSTNVHGCVHIYIYMTLCSVRKRSGTHKRPEDARLKHLIAAVRDQKVFVKHAEGRSGSAGHPVVPRSITHYLNHMKMTASFRKHQDNVGTGTCGDDV